MNIKDLKPGQYKNVSPQTTMSSMSSISGFPTQQPDSVKKSFFDKVAGFAGGVANPFLKLGATANALGTSTVLGGSGTNNAPVDLGSFGTYKPITTAKEALGTGAELASFAVGGGGAGGVVEKGLTGAIKEAAFQGLKTGAISGALTGAGRSLQEDKSIKSVIGDTVLGGLEGGALGGILGGATGAITSKLSGTAKIADTKLQAIIDNRAKELEKLDTSYKGLNKITQQAESKGFDIKKVLTESDLLHGAVDSNGTIHTADAIAELNDFMKPQESVISQALQHEGKALPLEEVKNALLKSIDESGLKGGAKIRAIRAVEDDIAGYALDATPDGMLPVSVIHDAKVDKYANINYLNPESKRADKAIAKGLKELVENNTDSVDVKALNNELAQFFTVQDYLEALNGKKVEGGKLGKYFAQTVGAVAGSHFGPLGSIAGAEIAGKLKGVSMASKFSAATGNKLEQSAAMQSAITSNTEKSLAAKVNDILNEVTPGLSTQDPKVNSLRTEWQRLQQAKLKATNKVARTGLEKAQKAIEGQVRNLVKVVGVAGTALAVKEGTKK